MLKRSHSEQQHLLLPPPPSSSPVPASIASLNTETSMGSHSQHRYTHGWLPQKGSKASMSHDLWSVRDQPNLPYTPSSLVNHKASARHPSLVSIFCTKQKSRSTTSMGEPSQDSYSENYSASRRSNVSVKDDLDHIHSAVNLDATIYLLSDRITTIKGRNGHSPYVFAQSHAHWPVTPIRCPDSPQLLLRVEVSCSLRPMQSTRLSNVEKAAMVHCPDHSRGRTSGQRRAHTACHHGASSSWLLRLEASWAPSSSRRLTWMARRSISSSQ